MHRTAYKFLQKWHSQVSRKPLVIRGARQVGKTHIVRQFAENFTNYVEVNFEQLPEVRSAFQKDLVPQRIIRDLSLIINKPITPGETLLFLDEIQIEPQAVIALRYFFEQLPELHVIAAGSLLDFTLESIGIPVGRVEFMYLYPMSFIEFLWAKGQELLAGEILNYKIETPFIEAVHNKLLDYLSEYFVVGGMPEAVKSWVEYEDIAICAHIHNQLIDAYRQDFLKYAKKFQIKYVDLLFNKVPFLLGQKFKYSKIDDSYRKRELEPCLKLLTKAGILHPVFHTAAQGLPLGAQIDFNKFKLIFLDIGLAQTLIGLKMQDWLLHAKQMLINKGEIVEAFVGQELLAYGSIETQHSLYYWQRESRASNAEVDYVIEKNAQVIPVEVKSDKGTHLKSMRIFLEEHVNSPYGIRFSAQQAPSFEKIISYPLYAIAAALHN